MEFSFRVDEINKTEIKLSVSKFTGSIILRKEMCLWIIYDQLLRVAIIKVIILK